MNIESNLGMALFTNEPSAAAAAGSTAGQSGNPAGGPEGSLFQQLISQMMTTNMQTAEEQREKTDGMAQDKAGETGNLLSELLMAGGNLAKIRLRSAEEEAGESMLVDGQNAEQLLAAAAGFGSPIQTGNMDGKPSEPQSVKAGTEMIPSEISSIQKTGNDFGAPESSQQRYILANSAADSVYPTEEKAAMTNKNTEPGMLFAAGNGKQP